MKLPLTIIKKSENVLYLMRGDALMAAVTRRPSLDGWRVFPNASGRRASHKSWPTPEAAIASMNYMTKVAARTALDGIEDLAIAVAAGEEGHTLPGETGDDE